jgi:hypothetical protein
MKANAQGSHKFLGAAVALLLLTVATATATPAPPTLAGPPEPSLSQPEPFYIRLEQPLTGAGVVQETVAPLQAGITIEPGDWYNLMAEEFDGDPFPPANWQVHTWSGTGWARHNEQQVSGSYSAGVVTTTIGSLNTRLFYGGSAGLAIKDVANAELNFNYWLDVEKDAVYFGWAASADGQNFYGAKVSGRVRAWLTGALDLRQYIGDDSVWVAFFVIGESTTEQQVYVDNVVARAQVPFETYLPAALKNYTPPLIVFTDDFTQVNSGWPHQVTWGATNEEQINIRGYSNKLMADHADGLGIIDGSCRQPNRYFMRIGNSNAEHVVAKAPVKATGNFSMEADIAFCDNAHGASTGLVFGLNDAMTEFYRVILIYDAVDATVKYAVWRDHTPLVLTSSSSYLNGGFNTNHVKVVRNGCTISLYLNDHLEKTLTNECAYSDRRWVGLFHDRYSYYDHTGATAFNFRLEGALEASD